MDYNYPLPEGEILYAIASVKDSLGTAVWDEKYIDLFIIDGKLISDPIILSEGKYFLNKLIIYGSNGMACYATPRNNSIMAETMELPLPQLLS